MDSINIKLPDGSNKKYKKGITGLEIAKTISHSLAKEVLSISVDEEIWDTTRPLDKNATIKLLTWKDQGGKYAFWHSSAHLLAEALESLYPGTKFGIGPPIENGFYYDVDFGSQKFDASHLEKIENKMLELAKKKNIYTRKTVSKQEALKYFSKKNDPYKLELINDLEDGSITFYEHGNFTDLCKGGHLPNTSLIKAIKLLNVAGAYWRGNEKNKQLTRIYGISFPKQKYLDEYLYLLEEAKKRDHRKLGKQLKLFTFSEKVGIGLPLWLPKGTVIREKLEEFLREAQIQGGYKPVVTPHIGHKDLYVTSGHYEKYGKDSFQPITTPNENEEFLLKPMNCPHHCEIYKSFPKSYKELPLRLAEFGTVYRYEQHGEIHGIARTRGFTQDDAHIFCTQEQLKEEFKKVIDLVLYVFKKLGFNEYMAQISLRDQNDLSKYIGKIESWDLAENAIREAAKEKNLKTIEVEGEAAFYGPKLDFMVKDSLKRKWQLGTVQIDYQLPERFQLEYIGEDNNKHRPIIIHRAPFGSLERFIAILLEHTAGNLPFWLAPDQIIILPISTKFLKYAQQIENILKEHKVRCNIDNRDEKIGKKIRDAEISKIPYMFILGEKEQNEKKISIRKHGEGDLGKFELEKFLKQLKKEF
ncbi:MAG: threonine--tRNA ligase [Bacteroidetes bacterium]|nr:threonine--tRNA ligase [Bacteroidota bacterium]